MQITKPDGAVWLLNGYGLQNVKARKALDTAIKKSFPGIVYRRFGDRDYFRLSTREEGYDFFFSVVDWALNKDLTDAQYIEEYEPGKYLSVTIKGGLPELLVTATEKTLKTDSEIPVYFAVRTEPLKELPPGSEEIEALSRAMNPSATNQYVPLAVFKANVGRKKSRPVAVLAAIVVVSVGWWLWPSENSTVIEDTVDPWSGYSRFLNAEASSVYYRFYQDALFQQEFARAPRLKGWRISAVDHNKNSVAYHLIPAAQKGSAGDLGAYIRDVNNFASQEPVQRLGDSAVKVSENSVTLTLSADIRRLKYGEERTIPADSLGVFYLLRDAIEKYVPGASLAYESAKPQSGGRWETHSAILTLEGVYVEDFVGLGSLMKDLPVAFGMPGQERGGSYDVAYKDGATRLSGRFLITIFGE